MDVGPPSSQIYCGKDVKGHTLQGGAENGLFLYLYFKTYSLKKKKVFVLGDKAGIASVIIHKLPMVLI